MPTSDDPLRTTKRPGGPPTDANETTPRGSTPSMTIPEAMPVDSQAEIPLVAGYDCYQELARGGMGVVYSARQVALDREVAIKTLLPDRPADADMFRRFVTESHVTAQLQHPAVPPVFEVGQLSDGRPYMVMKLIRGRDLSKLLRERPTPAHDVPRFLAVFEQICQAVGFAHARGIIHRDLKPSNVMLGAFGEVLVMDWGLARSLRNAGCGMRNESKTEAPSSIPHSAFRAPNSDQTAAGRALGTPAYMAPEQARGEWDRVGPRADVFALGGILADILTGRPPFVGETALNTLILAGAGALEEAFARLDASGADPELIALAKQALAPKLEARPADGKALADAVAAYRAGVEARLRRAEAERAAAAAKAEEARLRAAAEAQAKQAAEERADEATRRAKAEAAKAAEQRKRRRTQLWLAATTALLLFSLGGFAWWQDRQARQRDADDRNRAAVEEAERKAAADRDRAAARAALALAADLRKQQSYREAAEAVAQAEKLAAGLEDVAPAVRREKGDIAFARDLDAVRARKWQWVTDANGATGRFDASSAPDAYAQAFAARGLDIERGPATLARRISESPIRAEILRALDDWALTVEDKDPAAAERAWAVAFRAGPPNELATKLRDPAVRGKPGQLNELIKFADDVAASVPATLFVAHLFEKRKGDPRVLLEVAQAKHPTDFDITFALAMLHHSRIERQKEPAKADYHRRQAISHYRTARAIRPDHPAVLTNLGLLLGEVGELGAAAAVLREATRLHPRDHVTHFNLGGVLYQMARPEKPERPFDLKLLAEAEDEYRKTIELSPNYGAAYSNLAAVLGNRGRNRDAADLLAKAVALDPNEPTIRSNYGLALQRSGDSAGAMREYKKAVELDPGYATGHLNIGALLEIQKDWDGAEKALREAARLDQKEYGPVLDTFLKRRPPKE